MALRSRNKVSAAFSMSGMTDIVFLLLIFFMITSTLIHPTALKLLLPKSSHQTSAKPLTTVSITSDLQFYVEDQPVDINDLERILQEIMGNTPDAYVSIHADRSVDIEYVVKVLSITQSNNYKVILATTSE
jgi:biopolymer transport protein ExbD